MANVTRNIIFVVFLVTFVLFLLAFSTPWWVQEDEEDGKTFSGLWMACFPDGYYSKLSCISVPLDGLSTKFRVTQAMMCLALVANVTALCLFIVLFCKERNGALAIIAPGACIAGGLLNLIGVAVFGSTVPVLNWFGWSFILACVTTTVGTLNGIVAMGFVIHKRQDDDPALLSGNNNA